MNYICDCEQNPTSHKVQSGRGAFNHTKVDAEGICIYCGHYAMEFRKIDYRRGSPNPYQTLDNLYGVNNNLRKRNALENGQIYNSFDCLSDIAEYWQCNNNMVREDYAWAKNSAFLYGGNNGNDERK